MPKEETIELRHIRGVIGEKEDLPSYNPRTSVITKLKTILLKMLELPELVHKFGTTAINETITLLAGEDYVWSIHTDGNKLYVGLGTIPGTVVKIDLANFIRESVIHIDDLGSGGARRWVISMTSDGTYLYVGFEDFRPGIASTSISKILIANFTIVSELTLPFNRMPVGDMLNDGTYIYSLSGNSRMLSQVSIETFTLTNSLDLGNAVYNMCLSERYIYSVSQVGVVNKIDIDSFTIVDTLTYAGEAFRCIYSDGNYLYVGNYVIGAGNTKLYRIDINTFTKKDSLTLTDADYPINISRDGTCLYISSSSSIIIVVDILNFKIVKRIVNDYGAITTDGLFLYTGTALSPATITRTYLIPTINLNNKVINNINTNVILSLANLTGTVTNGTYSHSNDTNENNVLVFAAAKLKINLFLDMVNIAQNTTIKEYIEVDASTYRQISQKVFPTDFDTNTKTVVISIEQPNKDYKVTFQSGTAEGSAKDVPYSYITVPRT